MHHLLLYTLVCLHAEYECYKKKYVDTTSVNTLTQHQYYTESKSKFKESVEKKIMKVTLRKTNWAF